MSSRFVSAGKIGSSGELSKDANGTAPATEQPLHDAARSKEWEAVQQELEAERQRREEQRVKAATGEGEKSLYDVLQANKAAKQAAFEEQTKLRNQFRALDDDEIEFLDEIRANKHAEEERVRRETEEGLKAFRERQKGGPGDKQEGDEASAQEGGESWEVGRKRKRVKEREVKGLRRKASTSEEVSKEEMGVKDEAKQSERGREDTKAVKKVEPSTKPPVKKGLGLVGYGSDSDSDE
ncbi:nefa-interacting nuclear nip30 [Fusarium albosuccineum]|uniref:Nefa-interacting nuclear nip30 n=1 Tax=Fusarium albosuccineum TaxID=1237068 RepID=A0A8H4LGH7_9HYPO|nr:nefa-interacting nuclear nip30 [Fusarium albosuccineum]